MSINLTPEQEHQIQTKLQSGKYHSVEEVFEIALRLLDEYDRANAEWVEEVRTKLTPQLQPRPILLQLMAKHSFTEQPLLAYAHGRLRGGLSGL